jgi:hypothetical protein
MPSLSSMLARQELCCLNHAITLVCLFINLSIPVGNIILFEIQVQKRINGVHDLSLTNNRGKRVLVLSASVCKPVNAGFPSHMLKKKVRSFFIFSIK